MYTGGADTAIRVFSHAEQFRLVCELSNHHTHPVRSLAFSPSGDTLASASDDTKVQLYNIPPYSASSFSPPKFESTLHRSQGPVLSLCWHPSSLQLALGCSDGVVRLVSVLDSSQVRELKGHAGSVRHVCYDPSGAVLASIDHLGVLMLTRHEDRSCLLMETVMQRSDTSSCRQQCRCAFSPDSQLLALPGKKDVSIRSREAGWRREQEAMRLRGGHEQDVSIVAWSGSGRYLLSASAGRVVVWEAESGEMLSSLQLEEGVSSSSVQWAVRENSILVMDEHGYVKKWQQPVPQHMPPPFKQEDADVEREMDGKEAADAAERSGDGGGEQAVDTSQLQPVGDSDEDDDDGGGKAEKKDGKKTDGDQDDEQAAQHRKRLRRAGEAAAARATGGDGGDGDGGLEEAEDDDMDGFIVDDTDGLYKDTDDDYLSRKARQSLTEQLARPASVSAVVHAARPDHQPALPLLQPDRLHRQPGRAGLQQPGDRLLRLGSAQGHPAARPLRLQHGGAGATRLRHGQQVDLHCQAQRRLLPRVRQLGGQQRLDAAPALA